MDRAGELHMTNRYLDDLTIGEYNSLLMEATVPSKFASTGRLTA